MGERAVSVVLRVMLPQPSCRNLAKRDTVKSHFDPNTCGGPVLKAMKMFAIHYSARGFCSALPARSSALATWKRPNVYALPDHYWIVEKRKGLNKT